MLSTIVTEWSSAAASAKATIATHNVGARLPRQLELMAINNGKIVQYIDQNSNSMLATTQTCSNATSTRLTCKLCPDKKYPQYFGDNS